MIKINIQNRFKLVLALASLSAFLVIVAPHSVSAATFTVTSTNPTGSGSLEEAIVSANSNGGADTINFNIAGGGEKVITRSDGYGFPALTDQVTIDGTSQMTGACDGTTFRPLISIIAGNTSMATIQLGTGSANSVVQGVNLTSTQASGDGALSILAAATGVTVRCNFIGLNADGTAGRTTQGIGTTADNTIIGGASINDRNIFGECDEGNGSCIVVGSCINPGEQPSNVVIRNNYIGTDVTGMNALHDDLGGTMGVSVACSSDAVIRDNTISGNGGAGIYLNGSSDYYADGTQVMGNLIGMGSDGSTVLGNGQYGIWLNGYVGDATIGSSSNADRNIIGNNASDGIRLNSSTNHDNLIQNNFVGVDETGVTTAPNGLVGINVNDGMDNIILDNVISGNIAYGISLSGSQNTKIMGNHIGTDITDTEIIANGSHGVALSGATETTIGGLTAADGNVIKNNNGYGIYMQVGTTGTFVSNNSITDNVNAGVYLEDNTDNNTVIENEIHDNGGLGIDLQNVGVSANDSGDGDTGPNGALNFPVVRRLMVNGANTDITYQVDVPAGSYRFDFCSNPNGQDPTGYGECEQWVSSEDRLNITSGVHYFTFQVPGNTFDVDKISMTTTQIDNSADGYGSTSELGNYAAAEADLQTTILNVPDTVTSTGSAGFDVRVQNAGPATITATIIDVLVQNCDVDSIVLVNGSSTASNIGTYDDQTGEWAGVIQAGQAITLHVICTVSGQDGDTIDITATTDDGDIGPGFGNLDPNDTNNQATDDLLILDIQDLALELRQTTPGPFVTGDPVSYTATVSSVGLGLVDTTSLSVVFVLPAQSSFDSITDLDIGDGYNLVGCAVLADALSEGFSYSAQIILCGVQATSDRIYGGESFEVRLNVTATADFVSDDSILYGTIIDFANINANDPDYQAIFATFGGGGGVAEVVQLDINNNAHVLYNNDELVSTVTRCVGQVSPTATNDACFTISFNKEIIGGSFTMDDLIASSGEVYALTDLGDGTWEARVRNMNPGITSLNLLEGSVTDTNAQTNGATILGDNTVEYVVADTSAQGAGGSNGGSLGDTGKNLISPYVIGIVMLTICVLLVVLKPKQSYKL